MIDINQIKDRDKIAETFLVQQKLVPLNKNGKPYISVVLMNRSGVVDGRVWDNVDQMTARFESGDFLDIRATAVAYQHKIQLKIEWLERVDPSRVDAKDFLPATHRDCGLMLKEADQLINGIKTPQLRKFLSNWLREPEFREKLASTPAAKSIHHAYLGGLLEHTLSVMQLASAVCDLYSHLDRDLLIAGAFLHDIGKMHELEYERSFEYTDEGRLMGHIVLGVMMLDHRATRHPGLDQETLVKLSHMILSHHGSLEFGSPKRPKFAEALALNYLDEMDAKLQVFKEISEHEQGNKWSSFQRLFDRYLLLGKPETLIWDTNRPNKPTPTGKEDPPQDATCLELFSTKQSDSNN